MDPERKIEKWLRAYAKKRRAQTGGPFELHPATRRLLHGQLASSASEDEEDESPSLWEVLRRRWAFLLAFAAFIFLVASIFLPVLDLTGKKGGPAHSISGAVALDKIAPSSSSSRMPPVPEAAQAPAVGGVATAKPSVQTFTASPLVLSDHVTVAGGELTNGAQSVAMNGTSASALPAGPERQAVFSDTSRQSFGSMRGAARGVRINYRNTIAPLQSLPVLAGFQVQQDGNFIRIVDHDGSVYNGRLYRFASPPAVTQGGGSESYYFRVRGENRTLNESVVFTGRLLEPAYAKDSPQTNFGLGYGAGLPKKSVNLQATNLLTELPWARLRISGAAIVNRTNRVDVRASPVGDAGKPSRDASP